MAATRLAETQRHLARDFGNQPLRQPSPGRDQAPSYVRDDRPFGGADPPAAVFLAGTGAQSEVGDRVSTGDIAEPGSAAGSALSLTNKRDRLLRL